MTSPKRPRLTAIADALRNTAARLLRLAKHLDGLDVRLVRVRRVEPEPFVLQDDE